MREETFNKNTDVMTQQIFFSVGEPSGDLHAAKLIDSLRQINPNIKSRGFGGQRMVRSGLNCDFDLTQMAVVGISEVLPKLREFFRVADKASDIFDSERVDAVVLVDFPGFNWHIAKRAKQRGIPVLFYMPPQMWAWGGWRVRKLKRNVDRVLTSLPFESDWYSERGVDQRYVGHPFFDEVADHRLDVDMIVKAKSDEADCRVAILPGSRQHEVHSIWPLQLETIRRLHARHPNTRFMVAAFKDSHAIWCREQMNAADRKLPIDIYVGKTSEVIELSDCVLSKSGSVSLELMARCKPTTIVYRVQPLTYAIGRTLIRCNSLTLPNLVAGKKLMEEFLCVTRTEKVIQQLTGEMSRLIGDIDYRESKRKDLAELADQFARPGASFNAAQEISDFVKTKASKQFRPHVKKRAA